MQVSPIAQKCNKRKPSHACIGCNSFKSFQTTLIDMLCITCYLFPSVPIVSQLAPTGSPSLVNSMKVIQDPVKTCDKVYALIQSLNSQIRKRLEDPKSAGSVNLPYLFREEKIFSCIWRKKDQNV